MGCTLDRFTNYGVGQVVKDEDTGRLTAQLTNPPPECPDKSFTSTKAKLVVQPGVAPMLTYSNTEKRAIIMVPNKEMVQVVKAEGFGFFVWLLIVFCIVALGYAIYAAYKFLEKMNAPSEPLRSYETPTERSWTPRSAEFGRIEDDGRYKRKLGSVSRPDRSSLTTPLSSGGGGHTVIQSGGSNDGLLAGMVLGHMMSGGGSHHHHDTPARGRDPEPASPTFSSDTVSSPSFSSDDDNRSNSSYSSNSDSSYSSDSSSSYSSDSSSSSSYDSGSSSSDSGSSFSSD